MVGGKQGHAPCMTSSSKDRQYHGSQLLCVPTSPKVVVGGTFLPQIGAYNIASWSVQVLFAV